MKVEKITFNTSNNNTNIKSYHNISHKNNSSDMRVFYSTNSAEIIKNIAIAGITFTGNVEHMFLRKIKDSSHSDNVSYEAKLSESRSTCTSNSIDQSIMTVIENSKYFIPNSKIVGRTEKSELDYNPIMDKTVYFADNGEDVYSGIKSSYDYVVYPPDAIDYSENIDEDGEYDALSDWESFGWVDAIGPTWL